MSVAVVREAAAAIRDGWGDDAKPDWEGARLYHLATADLLDVLANRYDAVLSTFAPGSKAGAATAAENVTGWQEALALALTYLGRAS